jgi:hypothetical protein
VLRLKTSPLLLSAPAALVVPLGIERFLESLITFGSFLPYGW